MEKPQIEVNSDIPAMAIQAWKALSKANKPERLFTRAGLPVRIIEDGTLQIMTLDIMTFEVTRAADFITYGIGKNEGINRKVKVPRDLIVDMLAHPEILLPPLDSIRAAPCFSIDGELCATPGYHPTARVYLTQFRPLAPLPAIREAVALLDDMLCDVPFAGAADRANAFAMMLTPFVRDLIKGPIPMTGTTAGSPGTGKGLVSETCLTIGFGEGRYTVLTPPTDENELRKTITTLLMRGCPAVLFDNVESLSGSVISSLLTSTRWSDRVLGRNADFVTDVRWQLGFNGNNVTMTTETARRVVHIKLMVPQDRPWTRINFKNPDLKGWVHNNLPSLQAACVAIIQDWLNKDKPAGTKVQMGSFERYAEIMSGILTNAGISGFLGNRDELFESADTEGQTWREFVKKWAENQLNGTWKTPVPTQTLFELARTMDGFDIPGMNDNAKKMSFGRALSKKIDVVFEEYRIQKGPSKNGSATWKLESAKGLRDYKGLSTNGLFSEDIVSERIPCIEIVPKVLEVPEIY